MTHHLSTKDTSMKRRSKNLEWMLEDWLRDHGLADSDFSKILLRNADDLAEYLDSFSPLLGRIEELEIIDGIAHNEAHRKT